MFFSVGVPEKCSNKAKSVFSLCFFIPSQAAVTDRVIVSLITVRMTQFHCSVFLSLFVLCVLVQCLAAFDIDGNCRSNGMRKPPRFGKRAGEDGRSISQSLSSLQTSLNSVLFSLSLSRQNSTPRISSHRPEVTPKPEHPRRSARNVLPAAFAVVFAGEHSASMSLPVLATRLSDTFRV